VKKNLVFDIFFFFSLFFLDRLTKYLSLKFLEQRTKDLGVFTLRLVRNTGGVFGIGKGLSFLWIIISIIIFFVFLYWYFREINFLSKVHRLGYIFILEGAFSNILDRFFYGYVIDFIDFKVWPVFNLSDTFITLGILIFIFRFWSERGNKNR